MDLHIKNAIKRRVWSVFNHHSRGDVPSIGLFGSRRSGTTLLAQALGSASGLKTVDQPLSIFTADLIQKRYIPIYAGGFLYDLDEGEMEILSEYFARMEFGDLHISEPWRVWEKGFHFRTNRILYKCTDAHGLAKELACLVPLHPIYLFRHPIPQSLSCMRHDWPPRGGKFLFQKDLLDMYFEPNQQKFIKEKARNGSLLQKHLLTWFLENAPLVNEYDESQAALITYEGLVSDPKTCLKRLCERYEIEFAQPMLAQFDAPSRSSRIKESQSNISDYLSKGRRQEILTDWMEYLTENQKQDAREIFDWLGNGLYTYKDPMPAYLVL